jgi:CDP-paratose 2-epimerase
MKWRYVDKAREGDHICYISDLTKMRQHYPNWKITKSLDDIFREIIQGWMVRRRSDSNADYAQMAHL